MNPLTVLREATRAVPFMKYVLGLAGIGAAIALVKSFGIDYKVGIFGTVIVLALAGVLFSLARLSKEKGNTFRTPLKVLMWSIIGLFILTCSLLITCAFFNYPRPITEILANNKDSAQHRPGPAVPDPGPALATIRGHVYWSDNTPVVEAFVIPSIFNVEAEHTNAKGEFRFSADPKDISNPLILNVRGGPVPGITTKAFDSTEFSTPLRIIVEKKQAPVNPGNPVNPGTRNEADVLCEKFYKPLQKKLAESKSAYNSYSGSYKFTDANKIARINEEIIKLLNDHAGKLPSAVDGDVNTLVQHLTAWTASFKKKKQVEAPKSGSTFRVIYKGTSFPEQSVNKILTAKGSCLR